MNNSQLPFSQAAENNKRPILAILESYITNGSLFEMGCGTGQHAEYMSEQLQIPWQPADVEENIWIINELSKNKNLEYIQKPKVLKIGAKSIKQQVQDKFDYIYSANTLHIMSEENAVLFCNQIKDIMKGQALLFLYGPFKFSGSFTSNSNEAFDQSLKSRNPQSGIRDFEKIQASLDTNQISFEKRFDLPANNQLLVFKRN